MKALFVKTIALAVVFLTSTMNANLSAKTKYVVNYETENSRITSKTVYTYNGTLHNHVKYNYNYGTDGLIANKEAFRWNESGQNWEPYYLIAYTYSENEDAIELALWHPDEKTYSQLKERNVYQKNGSKAPVSCSKYKWRNESKTWNFTNKIEYNTPVNTLAYADIE